MTLVSLAKGATAGLLCPVTMVMSGCGVLVAAPRGQQREDEEREFPTAREVRWIWVMTVLWAIVLAAVIVLPALVY